MSQSQIESLESRKLLASTVQLIAGTLTITGTTGADDIYMSTSVGNTFRVADHNVQIGNLIPKASVKKVVVNTGDGNDYAYISMFENIPVSINGGNGNDGLAAATAGKATVIGGAGNDNLVGGTSADSLDGGDGDDVVSGASGNDTLLGGAGKDLLTGGAGNDVIDGGTGADRMRGSEGNDTVTYASRTKAVVVDLSNAVGELADDGEAGEKDFAEADIETVIGGSGADKLTGSTYTGAPAGFTRNNKLVGNGGNDTLAGLDGNDTIDGGLGTDQIIGGAGTDTADYGSRSDALVITLDGKANDGKTGENDAINADVENASGGSGADKITGNASANVLKGNGGNDTIYGQAGNDTIDGGSGVDALYGDDGNDTFYAKDNTFKDSLFGGAGADKAQRDNNTTTGVIDILNLVETTF